MLADFGTALSLAGGLVLALGAALAGNRQIAKSSSLTMDATMSPAYRFAISARHDARIGAWVLVAGFALQLIDRVNTADSLAVLSMAVFCFGAVGAWWSTRELCVTRETERFIRESHDSSRRE